MISEQFFVEGIQCRLDSGYLDEYIYAIGIIFEHSLDTADLTLYSVQSVLQVVELSAAPMLGFVGHSVLPLNLKALDTTQTELRLIAKAPTMGESKIPREG